MSINDIRGHLIRALERSDTRFGESYFVRSMATELQCPPRQVMETVQARSPPARMRPQALLRTPDSKR